MGKHDKRLKGGVDGHVVSRIKNQYGCVIAESKIRQILRQEKKETKNGFFVLSKEALGKLRLTTLPPGRNLIGIVTNGTLKTLKDKSISGY